MDFKQELSDYSTSRLRIYSVDGRYVRAKFEPDFTEGGHDLVYDWIPAKTIYVESHSDFNEMKCWLLHEANERTRMSQGLGYDQAHDDSNAIENQARRNPDTIDSVLAQILQEANKQAEVKSMDVIRKSLPLIIRKGTDGKDEIVITTLNYDRGNDRVFPSGAKLDNYLKNPVIMWIHDYKGQTPSAGLPVAKNSYLKVIDDSIIAGPPIFLEDDPFADRVKNAWDKGYLTTASIGFTPIVYEQNDRGGTDYTEWEMLEWSFAPIPMNAEAARIAKSEGLDELVEREIISKPEETEDYFRIPVSGGGADKHKGHRIRTIDISDEKGIKALYCGECKVVITYLFDKKHDWTMERAEAWVKEHAKSFSPKQFSQAEIADEIDYLKEMISEVGLGEETKLELKRFLGGDTPIEDKAKFLTQKTTQTIKDAMDSCDRVSALLDGHHKAHGEAYNGCRDIIKSCKDGLNLLLPPPQLPADEPSDEEKALESLKSAFELSSKIKFLEV